MPSTKINRVDEVDHASQSELDVLAKAGYTADEAAFLTPTERAAIIEEMDEGGTEQASAAQHRAQGRSSAPPPPAENGEAATLEMVSDDETADDDEEEGGTKAGDGTQAAPGSTDGTDGGEAKPAVSEPVSTALKQDPPERFVPELKQPAARDFTKEIATLNTKLADAKKTWRAGDMTDEEFDAVEAAVVAGREQVVAERTKAETRAELSEEFQNSAWDADCREFLSEHPQYDEVRYPARYAALNATIVRLANGPDADKYIGRGRKALQEADRIVSEELGPPKGAARPAADPNPNPDPALKPAAKIVDIKRKPADLRKLPTTLAHVPNADMEDTGSDRFTDIDKLDGVDQERAIAALSPADYDEYLRRGSMTAAA